MKVPIRSMVVWRDVAGVLDAELVLELELELPPEEPVAVLLWLLDTAVQTPRPVVPVTYVLGTENRDAQTGLVLTEASKLDSAESWLLMRGPLTLSQETIAEE
jgi:hypothetical protein